MKKILSLLSKIDNTDWLTNISNDIDISEKLLPIKNNKITLKSENSFDWAENFLQIITLSELKACKISLEAPGEFSTLGIFSLTKFHSLSTFSFLK